MDRLRRGQESRGEIFVLEDETDACEMLSMILIKAGYEVVCFADSSAFLATARKRIPACILLGVFVPGKFGIELLRELHAERYPAPVIVMAGRGNVSLAVSAMKLGAFDFIEKPFQSRELLAGISAALQSYANGPDKFAQLGSLYFPGVEPLSKREREVLEQLVLGASTKEAARSLEISPRTVEDHRSHIMRKLGAKNYADLIRIVMTTPRRLFG